MRVNQAMERRVLREAEYIAATGATVRKTASVLGVSKSTVHKDMESRLASLSAPLHREVAAVMAKNKAEPLYLNLHYYTDMARLGAQVVAGIGFIGAGAIIVTRRRRVKGLTTAAGLWAAAIVGLCLGGGFYEGGIFATALILAAEMFLSKLEYRMLDNAPEVNLYMEYSNKTCLDNVLRLFRDLNLKVLNMEITRSTETETHNACALFTLRLNKRCRVEQLIPKMNATEGVVSVEEL